MNSLYIYKFTPNRVVDGDTLVGSLDMGMRIYMNTHIRLWGINTAELHSKDEDQRAKAKDAKKFVEDNVTLGQQYVFESKEMDAFGRALGILYISNEITLNQLLLDKKLAVIYK